MQDVPPPPAPLPQRRGLLRLRFCVADRQPPVVHAFVLSEGATVAQALDYAARQGWWAADTGQSGPQVGVFGVPKALHEPLHDHDRVELYVPRQADPKAQRRHRVSQQARAGLRAGVTRSRPR